MLPHLYRPRWLRGALRRARFNMGRDLLLRQGVDRVVLYIWRPEFADALDLVRHDFSCYHIDDEYSFSRTELANSAEEVALIYGVDQVIVHSRRLMEKKGGINPRTVMIPNGVDYAEYATPHAEPADLARIPSPRIGYVGVIKTQLDVDLMLRLAQRMSHASFVFVGPIGFLGEKRDSWDRLTELPNVHALGHRDVTMLPAYTQHLDACVMSYEVTDYTNAIFPLKLNEYLAAGRPVVSSRIDSVLPFADVVRIAGTDDDWVSALEAALSAEACADALVQARRAIAREHDWDRLVARIAELFRADPTAT
jgi:glycosyltransferase involved in cell wall biosynthesis